MTDDEIAALAHRMASAYTHRSDPTSHAYGFVRHTLIDFSRALMAAATKAERERCAKVCESVNNYDNPMTANDRAAAIRQGGEV